MTQLPFFAALDAARAQQLSADQHNAGAICCSTRTRTQLLLLFSRGVLLVCLVPFLRFHVACSVVVLICVAFYLLIKNPGSCLIPPEEKAESDGKTAPRGWRPTSLGSVPKRVDFDGF